MSKLGVIGYGLKRTLWLNVSIRTPSRTEPLY
jgi:hypothetical protein